MPRMQKYEDVATYKGSDGIIRVLDGATITVYDRLTTNLAAIFSDEGITPKANPFYTDSEGRFSFYTANSDKDIMISKVGFATQYRYDVQFGVPTYKNFPFQGLDNFSIKASVADKALTVEVAAIDGTAINAAEKAVQIAYRKSTLTSGSFDVTTLSDLQSITLSSGSTLGFTAAEKGRIYVWSIYNLTDVIVGLSRTADIHSEAKLITTVAEDGMGGATDATKIYTPEAAYNNTRVRLLGYIEIQTGAVAGEWDNAPTKIQLYGPGIRKTGDTIQEKITESGAVATGTTIINLDDTIPQQSAEGTKFLEQAITPTYDHSIFEVEVGAIVSPSLAAYCIGALFIDSVEDALAVDYQYCGTTDGSVNLKIKARYTNQNTTAKTFKFHAGLQTAGTITFNGYGGNRKFGGVLASYIKVRELEP